MLLEVILDGFIFVLQFVSAAYHVWQMLCMPRVSQHGFFFGHAN